MSGGAEINGRRMAAVMILDLKNQIEWLEHALAFGEDDYARRMLLLLKGELIRQEEAFERRAKHDISKATELVEPVTSDSELDRRISSGTG